MIINKGKKLTIEEKIQILVSTRNIGKIKSKSGKNISDVEKLLREIKCSIKVAYREGKLTKEQIELLEANGMVWEEHKQPGRKSLDVLIASGRNLGEIRQNGRNLSPEERKLASAKHTLINLFNKGKLSKEIIEEAESYGMVWSNKKPIGRESLDVLIASGRNLADVKQRGKDLTDEEIKLGNAKHTLIVLYKKGLLSEEIIREAEEHGMVWGRKPLGRKELDLLIASGRDLAKIQQKGKKLTEEEKRLGEAKHTLINYYREGRLLEEIISEAEQYGMTWGRRIKARKKQKTDDGKDTLESLRAEKQELETKEKRAKELLEEVERAIEEKGEER